MPLVGDLFELKKNILKSETDKGIYVLAKWVQKIILICGSGCDEIRVLW